jgi:periplasmic mercuric ion binding protein
MLIFYYSIFKVLILNSFSMKSIRFIAAAIIVVISGVFAHAQAQDPSKTTTIKTETFKVWGNCDMCKTRIEKAAKIDGVKKAEWNQDTKILTLVYNPSAVKSDDILRKVAAAGHDTEKFKASDEAYKNLPGCCQYNRNM